MRCTLRNFRDLVSEKARLQGKPVAEPFILNPLSIGYISGEALMQEAKGKNKNK
jgi:hypothetical protein